MLVIAGDGLKECSSERAEHGEQQEQQQMISRADLTTATTTAFVANSLYITPEWSRCCSCSQLAGSRRRCRRGAIVVRPAAWKIGACEGSCTCGWQQILNIRLYANLRGQSKQLAAVEIKRSSERRKQRQSKQHQTKLNLTMRIIKSDYEFALISYVLLKSSKTNNNQLLSALY